MSERHQCRFRCDKCMFVTKNESDFKKHYVDLHKPDNGYVFCRDCGHVFISLEKLISHVKSDCSKIQDIVMRCGEETCGHFTTDPLNFLYHVKIGHRNTLLSCFNCNRCFTIPLCLLTHIQLECPIRECNLMESQSCERSEPQALVNTSRPNQVSVGTKNPYVLLERLTSLSEDGPSTSKKGEHFKQTLKFSKVADNNWRVLSRFPAMYKDSDSDEPTREREIPIRYKTDSRLNKISEKRPKKRKHFATSTTSLPSANRNAITTDEDNDLDNRELEILMRSLVSQTGNEAEKCQNQSKDLRGHCSYARVGKETEKQMQTEVSSEKETIKRKGSVIQSDANLPIELTVTSCTENEMADVTEVAGPASQRNFQSWNDRQSYLTSLKSPEAFKSMHQIAYFVKKFKCMSYSCTFTTDCKLQFVDHLVRKHCNAKLPCLYCLELFDAGIELVEHTISSHDHWIYQCGQCLYRAATKKQLQRHSESVHDSIYCLLLDLRRLSSRK